MNRAKYYAEYIRASIICATLRTHYHKHTRIWNILLACVVILTLMMAMLIIPTLGSKRGTTTHRRYRARSDCATQFYVPEEYVHNVKSVTHLLTLGDSSSYNTSLHSSKGSYWNLAALALERQSYIRVNVGHVEDEHATLEDMPAQLRYYLKEHGDRTADGGLAILLMLSLDKWLQSPNDTRAVLREIMLRVESVFDDLERILQSTYSNSNRFGQGVFLYVALPPDPSDGMGWMPAHVRAACIQSSWIGRLYDIDQILSAVGVAVAGRGWSVLDLHDSFLGHGQNAKLNFGLNYYSHGDAEAWLLADSCTQLSSAGHIAVSSLLVSAITQRPRSDC